MPIWTCLSTELSEVKSILQQLKHELANRSTASREHTHFHTCLIGGILFMRIQTALLLKLDTDHPRIFPRHPEMAVKWKHLISVFMLVLSLYSLSISRVKKKKKIYDSLFSEGCCFLCSFSSCFWIRFSPCLYTAHWSSFYIPGLYIYGSISKLHNTIFCPSVVSGALKLTWYTNEKENGPRFIQCHYKQSYCLTRHSDNLLR